MSTQQQYLELSDEARNAVQKREQVLRELEVMNLSKTILAPTDDQQVKLQLRALGHPICLFGEGPADRRDRLKVILARIQVEQREKAQKEEKPIIPESIEEEEEEELFFTEGPAILKSIRFDIAQFSLKRARDRLNYQHSLFEKVKKQAFEPNILDNEVQDYRTMIRELKTFDCLASQIGDHRPISSVSVVPFKMYNKRLALSSSWSGYVKIWDIGNWTSMQTYKAHNERIVHAICSPLMKSNEQLSFATASADKTIKVWTVYVNERVEVQSEVNHQQTQVIYNENNNMQDGEENATIIPPATQTVTADKDMNNTTVVKCVTLTGHTDRLSRLCYHQTGKYLMSTSFDQTWRFWDLEREMCVYEQEGHAYAVYAIAMHPDGSLCATSDIGGIVRVWDLRTGRTIIPIRAHVKQCLSLDFSANGYHMATSSDDNSVKIWDLRMFASMGNAMKETKCIHTIPAHLKLISRVQYEPSHGRFLTTASYDGTIKIWDSLDYKLLNTLKGHENKIMYTDMTPPHLNDSVVTSSIISCGYDRTLKLWWKSDDSLRLLENL